MKNKNWVDILQVRRNSIRTAVNSENKTEDGHSRVDFDKDGAKSALPMTMRSTSQNVK